MKIKLLMTILITLVIAFGVSAVESSKPADHNTSWETQHGQKAILDEQTCFSCHDEKLECITCHEDTPPRNHTTAWTQKNHGLEARWDKKSCTTCHREDFCVSCHESTMPFSHNRANFKSGTGSHCQTSCVIPKGRWSNTPNRNCITCHRTRPILPNGAQHPMK